MTLAGITVEKQLIAVANLADWRGDGVSSGIVGLGFPSITSKYAGTEPSMDNIRIPYNPIFTNMHTEGSVPPVFSIAIKRNNTGVLAIGGVPAGLPLTSLNASTPFEYLLEHGGTGNTRQHYAIHVGAKVNGRTIEGFSSYWHPSSSPALGSSEFQAVVDCGTTALMLPNQLSELVNGLFEPPAVYSFSGVYSVNCSATPPNLEIIIGDTSFPINSKDMILASDNGTCISGVTDAGGFKMSLLGGVFHKSVLVIHDVGAGEMRFIGHEY